MEHIDWLAELDSDATRPRPIDLGDTIPAKHAWRFLSPGPFTRTMLEKSADMHGGPLSWDDLADIAHGKYLFTRRQEWLKDYLRDWADQNPDKLAGLVSEDPTGPHRASAHIPDRVGKWSTADYLADFWSRR